MKSDDILDMIDHTLSDYTSPDAMRWTPEVQPEKGLKVGDALTINQVRGALHQQVDRQRAIVRQLEVETGDGWFWNDDTVYRIGPGTITTVDPHTGQAVETPYTPGTWVRGPEPVRPLPGWPVGVPVSRGTLMGDGIAITSICRCPACDGTVRPSQ